MMIINIFTNIIVIVTILIINNIIAIDIARQQGKDPVVAGSEYNKKFPRYGDPEKWDPNETFNTGLLESDAYIYPEFASRVDAWHKRTPDANVELLIEQHGTLNSAIRKLVSLGAL